ncbi:hypothetical protein VNI00_013868 [Paramarasmius palmivorus]|uniref:Uncharacterized protein n=1 Tax=Paramarasmius palmivorus TaxID=297713 RepID=A0AAW0BVY8_9AGAR
MSYLQIPFLSRHKPSRNALNIAVIPQEALITMLASLSRFGLSQLYPNVFENAYTPYNQAHRAAATAVLQEAITSNALNRFGVPTSSANMFSLHNDLYNHIVFTARARAQQSINEEFPARAVNAIGVPAGASDDEMGEEQEQQRRKQFTTACRRKNGRRRMKKYLAALTILGRKKKITSSAGASH